MSEPIFVMARFEPKKEYYQDARNAIAGIVDETRQEPGCRQFYVHECDEDGAFYLYEEWEDATARESHAKQRYAEAAFENLDRLLTKPSVAKAMKKVA